MGSRIVWKESLLRGEWRDRHGRVCRFDAPYLNTAKRNVDLMLSRGVPIPCTWEHQPVDAGSDEDMRAAYARHTFGHLVASRFNDRGNLELGMLVPDDQDRQQLVKTRFVSPKLYQGFRDSKGGVYHGPVIGHLAATPTPVQFGQRPFEFELADDRAAGAAGAAGAAVPTGRMPSRDPWGRAIVGPSVMGLAEAMERQRHLAVRLSEPPKRAT
jgi:hypothetical protein